MWILQNRVDSDRRPCLFNVFMCCTETNSVLLISTDATVTCITSVRFMHVLSVELYMRSFRLPVSKKQCVRLAHALIPFARF